jgi:hypothetical protein
MLRLRPGTLTPPGGKLKAMPGHLSLDELQAIHAGGHR